MYIKKPVEILTSRHGDNFLRGSAKELEKKYEAMGYGADREKNYHESHFFWQMAEHYKKVVAHDPGI